MGLILKCSEIREKTKHLRSCNNEVQKKQHLLILKRADISEEKSSKTETLAQKE